MSRTVLLCLILYVGAASAWGNWFSKNKNVNTECGKFETLRQQEDRGWWFSRGSKTDVDTRQLLSDLKVLDADNDGFLTYDEFYNEAAILQFDSSLDLSQGISRCVHTMFEVKRFGFDREVASNIFDLLDLNSDLVVNRADVNPAAYNQMDGNGDGRVSMCEAFKGFLSLVQIAENKVFQRDRKYQQLVYKHRKPMYWYNMRWW